MKKSRIILLCMMILLCALVLCSCGDDTTTTTTTPSTSTSTRPGDDNPVIDANKWDDVNFGDDTIRLQLSRYDDAELMSGGKKYMQGPDGPSSDKVQNLVYTRNLEATSVLGLKVEYYYIDDGWGIASGTIIDTEKNAASKPDMYCDMVYDMMKATLDGCFRNVYTMTVDSVNADGTQGGYFEFTNDGSDNLFESAYLNDFMAGLTFSSDKMYLLGSQYYIDLIRAMMVLPVNIDMYDTKYDSIDQFYQDVIDGKWTWDYLMNVSQKIYNDRTGDGNTMDDILGFAAETMGGKSASGMIYSSNIHIVEVDDKRNGLYSFTYNVNNKQLYDIFDKIAQVFSTDGVSLSNTGSLQDQMNAMLNSFAAGNLLFAGCAMMGVVEAEVYQEMEQQFGLVPIPKLNESLEYNTLIHNVGKCGAISLSTTKPRQISAYIQYCSENSGDVVNEYYNYAMKYKYTSDAGTAEMLDLIYENIVSVREKALDDLLSASNADAKTYAWHYMLMGAEGNKNYQSNADQIASVYETAIRIKQSVIGQLLSKWKNLA